MTYMICQKLELVFDKNWDLNPGSMVPKLVVLSL